MIEDDWGALLPGQSVVLYRQGKIVDFPELKPQERDDVWYVATLENEAFESGTSKTWEATFTIRPKQGSPWSMPRVSAVNYTVLI